MLSGRIQAIEDLFQRVLAQAAEHRRAFLDFGIAKATQTQLTDKTLFTEFRQFIGTPAYVSPEQAGMSALDIDTRADVYSFGVLLYELLTGTTPFDSVKLREVALGEMQRIIRDEEPPKPSTRLSTMTAVGQTTVAEQRCTESADLERLLTGDLDWIVVKAMEKDRTQRYTSAADLARDVCRFLADEPIEARPPTIGLIAQDVEVAIPEAIEPGDGDNHGGNHMYLHVNNDPIIWTMLNAIKDLNKKLESENDLLKEEIRDLRRRMETLDSDRRGKP